MKKYRLKNNATGYRGFERDQVYDSNFKSKGTDFSVSYLVDKYPGDWELVEEKDPLLKDTDLGHYTHVALEGLLSNPFYGPSFSGNVDLPVAKDLVSFAIDIAEETIKQLKEKCQAS